MFKNKSGWIFLLPLRNFKDFQNQFIAFYVPIKYQHLNVFFKENILSIDKKSLIIVFFFLIFLFTLNDNHKAFI